MNDFNTGMWESLNLLYKSHGGPLALFRSGYLFAALALSALCWRAVLTEDWIGLALSALPTLAGFSIAAFAILFSVLDQKERAALSAPEKKLGNRSPLLILAAAVSHAVITQLLGTLYAFAYSQKPFPAMLTYVDPTIVNLIASSIGLVLMLYAIILVLASVLSIFRVLEIKTRVSVPSKPTE